MAGTKWSAFPAGTTIAGTDVAVGLQGGADVQWTMAQLKTWTSASPTLVTPVLGVATGTSIALTGNPTFNGVLLDFSSNTQFTLTSPGPTNRATLGQATRLPAAGSLNWTSSADSLGTIDLSLFRDAANTLAQRNGTTAQTFRVYATYTDGSNYERFTTTFNGSSYQFLAENAGTGSNTRNIVMGCGDAGSLFLGGFSTNWWKITGAAGHLLAVTDNTCDIGASGATRPRNVYAGTSFVVAGGVAALDTNGVNLGSSSILYWNSRSQVRSSGDGLFTLLNAAANDFGRLMFGGTTSSFPALKRSSAVLQVRLADDSAFAQVQGKLTTDANATTGLGAGVLAALTNASITITDASGQVYRVPCVI